MKELRMKKAFVCYYDAVMQIYKSHKPKTRVKRMFEVLNIEYNYAKVKRLEN